MRVVTVAGDPEREARLAAQLEQRRDVELVLRCMDRVEVLGAIRGGSLDAVVVVGDPIWFDPQCGRDASDAGTKIVALAPDPLAAERLRMLGAVVVLIDASVDDIVEAARGAAAPAPVPLDEPLPRGSVCAVWGPKGAPGRTTIAVELAATLAALEPDTLLVDADTYGGDISQLLGVVDDVGSIIWAGRLAARGELTERLFAGELCRIGPRGPVLLAGIPRSDLWPEISDLGWRELVAAVRRVFRFVVCDVGFSLEAEPSSFEQGRDGRNRLALSTLSGADHVVAVVRADPVGIKNFLWAYERLREVVDEDRVLIVANRVQSGERKEVADLLKRYLRTRRIVLVPDEPPRFAEAVASGTAVCSSRPGSAIASAIQELADAVGAPVPHKGFLSRLGGRA